MMPLRGRGDDGHRPYESALLSTGRHQDGVQTRAYAINNVRDQCAVPGRC